GRVGGVHAADRTRCHRLVRGARSALSPELTMALNPFRWLAALIAACLAVSVIIMGFGSRKVYGFDRAANLLLSRYTMRSRQATRAAGRLRLAQLMDSTRGVTARSRNAEPIRVFT